ncbi:MAG: ankyrin repeat domain-containing protein [Lentisphaeraceae bacterium]|nr:ankyrin repeat domain-containing protein [Lentisphaeraceae bacterium]
MKTNDQVGRFFRDVEGRLTKIQKEDFERIYKTGNFPLVKHFLEEHDLIHFMRDAKGNTILHLMAAHQTPKNLLPLIAEGLDVRAENDRGETPLHCACSTRCISNVELLVYKGADMSVQDYEGNTILHIAAANGRESIIELLINKGLSLHQKNKLGETPLDLIVKYEHFEIAAKYNQKIA